MLTLPQAIVKTEIQHPIGIEDTAAPHVTQNSTKESKAEKRLQLKLHAEKLQLEAEKLKAAYEQTKESAANHMSNFLSELESLRHENQVLRSSVQELTLKQGDLEKTRAVHRFKRSQAEQNAKLWRTERNKAKAEVAKLHWKLQRETAKKVQGTEDAATHENAERQESELASLRSALSMQKKKCSAKVRKLNNKWAQYIMQNLV